MAIHNISPYVITPTNKYKQIRDISHEIKRIQATTQYIREHKVIPRTLSYSPSKSNYALKKLNII